jgi:1-acyl-sn-glycerol-3-phosphate acyltransferase
LQRYHRYTVRGFENLEGGAALLVGYHGRPLAYDMCMLTAAIHDRLGYLPHGIIHEAFGKQPLFKSVIDGLGFVIGDGPTIERAVSRGEHVLVQPGGTREGCRSFRHRYEVDWGTRMGFLKLALRHRLRIIPVAGAGVDDAFVGLNDGYRLGAKLGVPHRIPVWFGVGLGGLWPFALPLPVRMTQVIGRAIEPASEGVHDANDRAGLERLHRRVIDSVQSLLDEANPRTRTRARAHRASEVGVARGR